MISGISEPKIDGLLGKCSAMARMAALSEPSVELVAELEQLAATLRRTSAVVPSQEWWIPSALVALQAAADDLRGRLR